MASSELKNLAGMEKRI